MSDRVKSRTRVIAAFILRNLPLVMEEACAIGCDFVVRDGVVVALVAPPEGVSDGH